MPFWLLVYLGLIIVSTRSHSSLGHRARPNAAFGTCVSLVLGTDVHDWQSYASRWDSTLPARLSNFTRSRDQRVVPTRSPDRNRYVVAAAWQLRSADQQNAQVATKNLQRPRR